MIDLCTDNINVLGTRNRETSLTSLSFRELPKILRLYLEIFRVDRLLENKLGIVAKSELNLLSFRQSLRYSGYAAFKARLADLVLCLVCNVMLRKCIFSRLESDTFLSHLHHS